MNKQESAALFAAIKENRRKLDACPRHLFDVGPPPYQLGQKVTCAICDGYMPVTDAAQYARGYMAAGGNPDDVIKNFYGPDYSHEAEAVTCPKCKGVQGVEISPGDWFDCDFCDATGKIDRHEALLYLDNEKESKR
ncbi:hypothetical protein P7I17_gp32 [Escherichia phage Halfdan]|uniref:Uncharacterized protein n=1 Tax=Escherichia phage Halfdan TaxID=2234092 RepID=A0A2Z5H3B4_9CAUD|nr:hypothetical protein P7I17_gp32 [Escherichia phage Halfdan]AXC34286.1 hypothetical protein [Escherichia phage Halfdan]